MIAHILPLLRLPLKLPYFSYVVPLPLKKELQIGSLVKINFRGKNISGLVIDITEKNKHQFPLKKIDSLINKKIITNEQLSLITRMAENLAVAKTTLIKSIIPKTKIKIDSFFIPSDRKINKKNRKELWWHNNEKKALEMMADKIKNIKNKKQILILVPEIEKQKEIIRKLKLNTDEVFFCSSKTKEKYFTENYLKLLAGKPIIVVGTQKAVLLPFINLPEIFIIQAESWYYKQSDINPRFDARLVANWLADLLTANLTLITAAPTPEDYQHIKNIKDVRDKNYKNFLTVDLKKEKMAGNFNFLGELTERKITQTINQKQKILILHNRKALANYLFCNDCGYVFKCPKCFKSMAYLEKNKNILCRHCGYQEEMPPLCPKCAGPNIKFKTPGVEKIKKELQKKYINKKIMASDKILGADILPETEILVATEFIINKIDLTNFALIIFTDFGQFLNQADFRAGEKAYQLLAQIRATSLAEIIIQTHEPDNYIIKSNQQNKPEIFYQEELANRQLFFYPPYGRLIKLICQDKNKKTAVLKAEKIINILNEKIKNKKIEIIGPLITEEEKIKKSIVNVIIKVPLNFELPQIFKLMPADVIIDVDVEKIN
ncbi:MAG TPA: primosomal protein N' [bacterium]|nr:primosomal protein N' [bacterium]